MSIRFYQNRGVSLVELMIAMALGSVLLSVLVQTLSANVFTNKTITGFSILQENARAAEHSLTQSFRLAGHYGGVDGDDIGVVGGLTVTGIGSCDQAWILNTAQAIRGFDGASSVSSVSDLPSSCIPSNQYVADSDVVVMRYGSAMDAAPLNALNPDKVYLRSAMGVGAIDQGELLRGSDASSSQLGADGVGTYNYEYKIEMFFLRPCSQLNGTACDDGVSTLTRYTLDGDQLTAEPIAEGVEQFQVVYGVDSQDENGDTSKRDYVADDYLVASAITNWREVVSARFQLVIRNEFKESGYTDTDTYTLAGGYDYTPETDVASYRRKVYSKVIQLRNMSRG